MSIVTINVPDEVVHNLFDSEKEFIMLKRQLPKSYIGIRECVWHIVQR